MNIHGISKSVRESAIKRFEPAAGDVSKALLGNSGGGFSGGPPPAIMPGFMLAHPQLLALSAMIPSWDAPDGNAVLFAQEKTNEHVAAKTAEGGTKPEYAMAAVKDGIGDFDTIAGYVKASTQILGDMSTLPGYIEAMIRDDVFYAADKRLMARVLGVALGSTGDIANDIAQAAIKGWTDSGQMADTVGLSVPLYFELAKIPDMIDVDDDGVMRCVGLQVAVSRGLNDNEYVVGPFQSASMFVVRERYAITVGMEGDDFVKNMRTVLGEMRAVWVAQNYHAFVKGAYAPGP
jgi:hypothetical protein